MCDLLKEIKTKNRKYSTNTAHETRVQFFRVLGRLEQERSAQALCESGNHELACGKMLLIHNHQTIKLSDNY